MADYMISPQPKDPRLTERVVGIDQNGKSIETSVTVERPLTLFLNDQEIVTMMTIGDYPDCQGLLVEGARSVTLRGDTLSGSVLSTM